MNRRTMFASGAAALMTAHGAPAFAQSAAPGPQIRIGYTLNDSGLEPAYALEQNMFAQAGLNVEIQVFQNAGRIAEALSIGAIEVGIVDCINAANSFIHGLGLAVFAGGVQFSKDSPTLVMVTEKTSPYRTAKDLEGQTVGVVGLQSLSSSATLEWLRVKGADPSKVKLFELPFPDMNNALARGSIAAALQGEPFLSAARNEQRQLGVPFEAIGKTFYVNVYAAKRTWLQSNTPLAHRLAAVFYQAGRWANAHRPETAVIESKYTKLPLEVARVMARNLFSTAFSPQLIAPVLDLGARYGLTSRPVAANEIAYIV